MEGTYDVMLGSQKMGSVEVTQRGLYWEFDCFCSLSGEVMYDLVAQVGENRVKLGLLSPGNGSFHLRAKLAKKCLGQGSPVFILAPRHSQMIGIFVSVVPDEPFRYLHKLESAYLKRYHGQTGIVFDK